MTECNLCKGTGKYVCSVLLTRQNCYECQPKIHWCKPWGRDEQEEKEKFETKDDEQGS